MGCDFILLLASLAKKSLDLMYFDIITSFWKFNKGS